MFYFSILGKENLNNFEKIMEIGLILTSQSVFVKMGFSNSFFHCIFSKYIMKKWNDDSVVDIYILGGWQHFYKDISFNTKK